MLSFRTALALALVTASLLASSSLAQDAPTFRSVVELVQLQVQVTDGDGRSVTGLGASDFLLVVDGQERPVYNLSEVDLDNASEESVDLPPRLRRHFLLTFDLRFPDWVGTRLARDAAAEFVATSAAPGDLFGIAVITSTGVDLVQPFSTDVELVSELLEQLGSDPVLADVDPEGKSGWQRLGLQRAIQELSLIRDRSAYDSAVEGYLGALGDLAEALRAVRGRKQLVLFSSGFDNQALFGTIGSPTAPGSTGTTEAFTRVAWDFRRADTVVHSVTTRRLRNGNTLDLRRMGDESEIDIDIDSLSSGAVFVPNPEGVGRSSRRGRGRANAGADQFLAWFSGTTDGRWYANLTEFEQPLLDIEESTRRYYVLSYARAATDPPLSRVQVRLRDDERGELVHAEFAAAPPSYGEMTPIQRTLQLGEVIAEKTVSDAAMSMNLRTLAGGAVPGHGQVSLVLPASTLQRFAAARQEPVLDLELALFAYGDGGGIESSELRSVGFEPAGHEYGLWFGEVIRLPSRGTGQVLIRDAVAGLPMQRSAPIDLDADPGLSPRLVGPVLIGPYDLGPDDQPRLQPDEALYLWFATRGFAAGEGTTAPVAVRGEVEDSAGVRLPLQVRLVKSEDGIEQQWWIRTVLPAGLTAGPLRVDVWAREQSTGTIVHGATRVTLHTVDR